MLPSIKSKILCYFKLLSIFKDNVEQSIFEKGYITGFNYDPTDIEIEKGGSIEIAYDNGNTTPTDFVFDCAVYKPIE